MTKKFLWELVLFCLFAINTFSQTIYLPKDVAGNYINSDGYVGGRFNLMADGKYEYESFSDCCDPVWREIGSFEVKETIIHLKINKHTLNKYNLLDPKEKTEAFRKLYGYKGEDLTAKDIKTEHDLQIISWGERIYLIKPSGLFRFVAALNLGIEPRSGIIHTDFLSTNFYLRRGDEGKIVSGKPNLPNEWLSYILDSPVQVTVVKFEGKENDRTYTVNKGSSDGLKVGMCFVGENVKLEYDKLLWVTSVEEHSAKLNNQSIVFAPDYKIGDVLTTKSYKNN